MLVFDVYKNGSRAKSVSLDGAYLLGQESVPIRADLTCQDGRVVCAKRAAGASGLALLWEVPPAGRFLLSTTRLPERDEPYNLNLELARGRMMKLILKREEWGLFDYPSAEGLAAELATARKYFVEAVKASKDDPAKASQLADRCLAHAVVSSENTALFHADILLSRRQQTNCFDRPTFGCVVDLFSHSKAYQERLAGAFDFVSLPLPWKHTEPHEGQPRFEQADAWIDWALRARLPVHSGPLVSFEPDFFPEWIYLWEHDYDTLREMIYEYVQRMVTRYAGRVRVWNVISAVHAYNNFNLNFEQIMELTRMTCSLVKQLSPRAAVVIDLTMPWGEYYARNQRTIPPMMYADMCVQSGVKFDAFGLQMMLGAAADGLFARDLMQISTKLDEFAGFGKALHVTACQVPSDTKADPWDHWKGDAKTEHAGSWRKPWAPAVQADWLAAFYKLALSKPFVETVCWRDLADYEGHYMPHGGLCNRNLTAKPAYDILRRLRSAVGRRSSADSRRAARPQADQKKPKSGRKS